MPLVLDDTIAAIASPPGAAPRGILRISGPHAIGCAEAVFRPDDGETSLAALRWATAVAGRFHVLGLRAALPGEVFVWPGPRSYTGQTVVEFHTLGSPPLLQALLRAVCESGARPAGPGEFTLRAFLKGRIDLTQAEAVAGVIDAADPAQLDVALAQLAGGLAQPLAQLRAGLVDLLADLEAGLDFPDEDLPFLDHRHLLASLATMTQSVGRLQARMESRTLVAELPRVVLVGLPNAGKSRLFNALTGARALVCDLPGTTRDYLTARLDLDGSGCLLIDTAGHEEPLLKPPQPARAASQDGVADRFRDELETPGTGPDTDLHRAAMAMTEDQHRGADLELWCLDASCERTDAERSQLDRHEDRRLVVFTKVDATIVLAPELAARGLATSSVTGAGLDALRRAIRERLASLSTATAVSGTSARCRDALRRAGESLRRATGLAQEGRPEELLAAEIRTALDEIGQVAGHVYTEDVLEVIFGRFCVGK